MVESSRDVLTYSVKQGKCFITLNGPEAMNALNAELRNAVVDAVQEFDHDDALFVGIITGAGGKAFSAGLDLKEVASKDAQEGKAHRNTGVSASEALSSSRKPIIAAIDGYYLAGGFEVALSCDIRIQKLVSDRDELMAEAERIADDILKGAPLATKAIKRVVRVGRNLPTEYSAKFCEAYRDAVYLSEARREGPKAFAEKREPQWKNR